MKWWLEEDVWERDDLSFLKRWAIFIGIIQEERRHNHESEKSVEVCGKKSLFKKMGNNCCIFMGIIQEERRHNHESEKSVERIIGGIIEDSNERAGGHGWAGV